LDAGLQEIHRVLSDAGRVVILEFTRPSRPWFRQLYEFYASRVLGYLDLASRQRRMATRDQIASTRPNGHAPCRNPYADPSAQDAAKAKMNQWLRSSKA
jgi:hypothetical protein